MTIKMMKEQKRYFLLTYSYRGTVNFNGVRFILVFFAGILYFRSFNDVIKKIDKIINLLMKIELFIIIMNCSANFVPSILRLHRAKKIVIVIYL